jgi:hypothetical protein
VIGLLFKRVESMNNWSIAIVFLVDTIIICFVIGGISRRVWAPLANQFPKKPFANESFRRNFQTVAMGSVSFGFSVHMVADDEHLHWIPARFMRIFGCKSLSIPWTSIYAAPKQPVFQKSLAKICLISQSKTIFTVPRWCVEIKNTIEPDQAQSAKQA